MIEIPMVKFLLIIYCFTGIHTGNYNVYDYLNQLDSIEHYYSKNKYNVGDTIVYRYTIMVDSTSEQAINYKKDLILMEQWAEETRLQEEAWAKDTVYQNKIKLEFQQKENEEAEIWLQEAAEKQMELEKLESKPIKKPE